MGIAGGLVPSPSALVVLLGAIALGRTTFGILLVLGYGLGMAATLTAAGILLVRLRDRLDSALAGRPPDPYHLGRPAFPGPDRGARGHRRNGPHSASPQRGALAVLITSVVTPAGLRSSS